MNDTRHFKEKLEAELETLEKQLKSVGRRNPENPDDWVATRGDIAVEQYDKNEVADAREEFEDRHGVLEGLERQYNEVKAALERIEDGTYGKCENGGENIPPERLKAFPAARTCLQHQSTQS